MLKAICQYKAHDIGWLSAIVNYYEHDLGLPMI